MLYRLLALIFAISLYGCSNPNNQAPEAGTVHDSGWLDVSAAVFHGAEAHQNGEDSCGICHGPDLSGSELIPGCTSCHFDSDGSKVPPGTNWQHGTTPHDNLAEFGDICNRCHGANRENGNHPTACHDCHGAGVSHVLGQDWLDENESTFHGESTLDCANCHDLDVKCVQCHFDQNGSHVPAGVTWEHGSTPHNQSELTTNNTVCNACHDLNRSYGNAPESCHDCHTHPDGQAWLDEKQTETFHGNSTLNCADCHDLDVKCVQCHFDQYGSHVPAGVTWEHGSTPHNQSELTANNTVCNTCHDLNRSYGNGPESCHDCHTHPDGQAWLDEKQTETFHGNSTLNCADCHDLDVKCVQCHFGQDGSHVPAGVTWEHGTVPHDDQAIIDANAVCNTCHELNRSYGNGPESCHDCHIHETGQPWLDEKQTATFHGNSTLECAACHDLDVKCVQCHFGQDGSHVPAGVTWTHGTVPHDDQNLIDANAVCATCHELNRSYGNSPTACHDCHTHDTGQTWLDKNQTTTFHGNSSLNCTSCHDLGVKCSLCHFGPNGDKVPSGVSWTHGNTPHDAQLLKDNEPVCNACHDLNRSYGNGPAACHDCHFAAGTDHTPSKNWINALPAFHGDEAETDQFPCQQCHGLNYTGGGSGTSCFSCHTDNPINVADCISCHNEPPDGITPTASRPNRDNAHTTHNSVAPVIAGNCSICHNNAGSGTTAHYDITAPADIAIPNGYSENTQTIAIGSASPVTCDSVRCHGGQLVTWTDTIDVNSDCTTCHQVGGSTYNRAQDKNDTGGLHQKHVVGESTACIVCHDSTKLNTEDRHFNDLDDTNVNEAGATISLNPDYGGTPGTYNQGAQTCTVTCHGENHDNWWWFD